MNINNSVENLKTIVDNINKKLDAITIDIKKIEEILITSPFVDGFEYVIPNTHDSLIFTYDHSLKRIILKNTENESQAYKPFIATDARSRLLYHKYLIDFIHDINDFLAEEYINK